MKIYGYTENGFDSEDAGPKTLREITLVVSPAELRSLASFLISAAESMERMGAAYSHEHLADQWPEFADAPELIVFNPRSGEPGATE